MLQQMTEDLNKNYDKIWEAVTALNNVRNNAEYKDAETHLRDDDCRLQSDRLTTFVLYDRITEYFTAEFSVSTLQ